MATSIKVLRDGAPVKSAKVLVGTLVGTELKTGANGKVEFDLAADWEGFVQVHIETDDTTAIAMVHIKEGRNHDVDIASIPIV
jgi:hypothetical protein